MEPSIKGKLNPQIVDVEIGRRNLRTIQIYPLTLGQQLKASDLVTEILNTVFQFKDLDDIKFISKLTEILIKNLANILDFVTEEENGESLLHEITNDQAQKIGLAIYRENYEDLIKNAQSLFQITEKNSISKGQLQQFANTMGTSSTISSNENGKMEG